MPPLGEHALACMPAILPEESIPGTSAGKVLGSETGALLIANLDTVYVGLTGGQSYPVGSRLSVIRPGRRVIHPLTKKPLGKVLYTLGILEVLEDLGKSLKARVVYSCGAVSVGDLVQAYTLPPYPVGKETVAATRQLSGIIVEALYGESLLGQYSIVFADLGAAQGAAPGDVFGVLRLGQPVVEGNTKSGQVYPVAPQDLASATVVRVGQQAATLVLTHSAKEVAIGDVVVLSGQAQP
jgi:hypothetical protein